MLGKHHQHQFPELFSSCNTEILYPFNNNFPFPLLYSWIRKIKIKILGDTKSVIPVPNQDCNLKPSIQVCIMQQRL